MRQRIMISNAWRAISAWLFPAVPSHILPSLQQAQFESVRKQVPLLLLVAAINTAIIMAVCAHAGLPPSNYGWMALLILYCIFRLILWTRRASAPMDSVDIPQLLRLNVIASLTVITLLGVACAFTFATGMFAAMLLVPASLGFGSMSIAHCLYTLRPASIGTVIMGMAPSAIAMILVGSFEAQMMGAMMLSVAVLMIRFVAQQYDQLIHGLMLADENHQLAWVDALTGLDNRRAIINAIEAETVNASPFAVALIDLDGFKDVNDNFGHQTGDALLCEVASRLDAAMAGQDCVGRLGGDEFVILFRNIRDEKDVVARADGLLAALCRPFMLAGVRVPFGASLGFAIHGQANASVKALLHTADVALYAAKRGAGRGKPQRRRSSSRAA